MYLDNDIVFIIMPLYTTAMDHKNMAFTISELWTVPPFLGTEKYLYNCMTSSFMVRFGPLSHYLKTSEADSRFGIDFRC